MDPIGGAAAFSFSSALVYQGLSTETPQQLQTAGVFTIPTSPVAPTPTTATSGTDTSDSTDTSTTPAPSSTPDTNAAASAMAALSASITSSNFFATATTYQLLTTGSGQAIATMGGSASSLGQQVDTQV